MPRFSGLDFLRLFLFLLGLRAQSFRQLPQEAGDWDSEGGARKTGTGRKGSVCHLVPERQHREGVTDQCEGSGQRSKLQHRPPAPFPPPPRASCASSTLGPCYIKEGRWQGGKRGRRGPEDLGGGRSKKQEGRGRGVSEGSRQRRENGDLTGQVQIHIHASASLCPHSSTCLRNDPHARR